MVTMAERLKKVETDITWIRDTNINQSKDIQEIKNTLNEFVNKSVGLFACKETEYKVDRLEKKWSYVAGAIAVLMILVQVLLRIF
jgi:archaellum component FlaC